ncbi:putative hydrolase (alpha/beta fold) [Polymorphobacter glacialis]|uniref:Hydrolase (Alpha/beta fold) n=2 Tax=Sandarakinorhabdus glacialis TaxID=1614636 RepID=A0A916ZIX7_9SPHN|nr:putative hydrolase (alpha/beta fold) [Polymorphobacter glacialis]
MAVKRFQAGDGIELVADVAGPQGAPAVILLHGGGQTRHSWAGAMTVLAQRGYRVISFDARGHGDSGWSDAGAYGLDDRAADLAVVAGSLSAPFAVVGASLGGATAIHSVALGLQPAAVVLVDIVPEPEAAGIARIVNFMRGNPDGFATLGEAVDAVAAYNPSRPRPRDTTGLMRNLRHREDGRLVWHWDPRILSDGPAVDHAVVKASAATLADAAAPPVLLVRGLQSDVVSDAGIAAFRALVPALEVVDVTGAGHMVAGDRNDAFNAGVTGFLERHLPLSGR